MPDLDFTGLSDEDLSAKIAESRSIPAPADDSEPETPPEELSAPQDPPAESPPAAEPEAPAKDPEPPAVTGQVPEEPKTVPLHVLIEERERRRQAENLLTYVTSQGPAKPEAPPPPEPPDRDLYPAEYAEWYANQKIDPLRAEFDALKNENAELKERGKLREIIPEVDRLIDDFDTARPDLVGKYTSREKALMLLGSRALDPASGKASKEAEDARIDAEVEKRLGARVAEALAKQQPPITAPKGVARAGSITPGTPVEKRPSQLSDSELAEQISASRRTFLKAR